MHMSMNLLQDAKLALHALTYVVENSSPGGQRAQQPSQGTGSHFKPCAYLQSQGPQPQAEQ